MNLKTILSTLSLFFVITGTLWALGAFDRTRQSIPTEENLENTAAVRSEAFVSDILPNDDPLRFLQVITGHDGIIKIHGTLNLEKLTELVRLANSGEEACGSGRRFFAYTAPLRVMPPSMTHRRLDIESLMARKARELSRKYAVYVDIGIGIREYGSTSKERYSFNYPAILELSSQTELIGRQTEAAIAYIVKDGNYNMYRYGMFYIVSAIPRENKNSAFHRIITELRDDNPSVIAEILEKIVLGGKP